jgi:hypothetical protein
MPDAWEKWRLWQYGDYGSIQGVYSNGARDDGGSIAVYDGDGGDGGPVVASADVNYFDGTETDLRAFIASTVSTGAVDDPAPLTDPPHVAHADGGAPIDCSDGCCIADP